MAGSFPYYVKEVCMIPQRNEIYRHFKGKIYKIITMATHSETKEQMVVYQGLYDDFPVYCRPLSMFVSEVDHDKYPYVAQKQRFEKVDNLVNVSSVSMPVQTADAVKVDDKESEGEKEEASVDIDPMILDFLDAETIVEKKNIVVALHHRITDEMINTLAIAMDVVIEEGELEDRYQQLKTCLDTIERYEIERK